VRELQVGSFYLLHHQPRERAEDRAHRATATGNNVSMASLVSKRSNAMFTRTITTATTVLLCCSALIGQTGSFEAGLQIGPGLGWLRGNKLIDATDPLIGLSAAGTLQYNISERLGLRAGIGIQRKGMRQAILLTDVDGNIIRQYNSPYAMDYVMVPLMLRASFGSRARLVVGAGPYVGILLRARQSFGDEGRFPTVDNTDNLKQWDMGISASLGAAFPLNDAFALQAEARYDKGLTNVSALPLIDDGSIRTNAVCLLFGCTYRFGNAPRS
jgi:hypothetical protein